MSAVGRGNSGRDVFGRVDRHRKGGAEGRSVFGHHHVQPQVLHPFFSQGQADQTAAETRHEVDRVRRDHFRRHAEIAFVLPVFVIHQDDHPAAADLVNCFFDGCNGHGTVLYPSRL
jgi:hypothetical protein